ncbi:hypothetical protein [Streptomyces griseomycini]|uniref:Uncharacterized protein n=1 Tax=Streptomyces griseomycini TaxID=66895 RepID=A0A7W7PWR5_9ACTN|nr:hypothetical protein [Streptomyces griseomycini]MBB4902603.1 hypothetical protein [Streptomyces griseomycini]GGR54400.1 hypothetical protein GCM10015536_69730 [Streptomyces griseomycini]
MRSVSLDRGRAERRAQLEELQFDDHFAIFRGRREPVDHWSDLLFQSTWWQDADRNIWRLDELDTMRCSRIYGFIAQHEDETGTRLAWESTHGPMPRGAVAFDAYERGRAQLLEMVSERGWIHRTDLMVALQRRMRSLPAVEGTCFCGYPVAGDWDHSACHAGMEIA